MSTKRLGVLALAAVVLIVSMGVAIADSARRAAVPDEYAIVDLGALGGLTSNAHDLNEQGQVVGEADTTGPWRRAFLWDDGVMTDLGTLPPIDQTLAFSINNLAQVVGMASNSGGTARAFIWEDGQMVELGDPAIAKTAYAINDARQVVGTAVFPGVGQHAFLLEGDVMTDLTAAGFVSGLAWDINSAGAVVGGPVIWQGGETTDIGSLGGDVTAGHGINDHGQVAGNANRAEGETVFHAFLWDGAAIIDLGAMGGFDSSRGEDINNLGQVVGRPSFLYDPVEGMIDLEDRLPFGSGWVALYPQAINDAGQIAGWGYHNGLPRGFLMTPVIPEIPAVSNFGAAVLAALFVVIGSVFALRARRAR